MGKENKALWAIGLSTVVIIIAGAYFLSRPPKPQEEKKETINTEVLYSNTTNKKTAPQEKAILVEFGDFQCPACGAYYELTKELEEEFKDNLSFVFRHYPLSQHKYARASAYAVEASGEQGKYWEMYDKLYSNQDEWTNSKDAEEIFKGYAKEIGLDLEKYESDIKSGEIKSEVDKDLADGNILGVNSTPTFYLNGEKLGTVRSYEDFQALIKAAITKNEITVATGEPAYHAHFDLLVYINGKAMDFSTAKFQESKDNKLDPDVHFHDGNGKVAHMHKKGITFGQFIKSLTMNLDSNCIQDASGTSYCNKDTNKLTMFVNGKENKDFEKYIPQDLDQIVLVYGGQSGQALQKIVDSATSDACIYSEKCPERGKPPTEECVGGVGTGCEKEE